MNKSKSMWACAIALALLIPAANSQESKNLLPGVDPYSSYIVYAAPHTTGGPATPAPPPAKKASDSWWTQLSLTPYGTVQHLDFSGKALWGVGIDTGYNINRTVSLHVRNTMFDSPETCSSDGGWLSGATVDETEALFRADLIQGGGKGRDRFGCFFLGSTGYNWNTKKHDIGVGPGAFIRFSKHVAFEVDYRVRVVLNGGTELGAGTAGLSFKF